jgi:hypothetical protein
VRNEFIKSEQIAWRERRREFGHGVRMNLDEGEPSVPSHLDDPCLRVVLQGDMVGRLNQELIGCHKMHVTRAKDDAVASVDNLCENERYLLITAME